MGIILGIDVGTSSLGLTVRNDDDEKKNLTEQVIYSSVSLFNSGVGKEKNTEFSFAKQRTGFRSRRKLYKVRRYRKWATLRLLTQDPACAYCPLSKDELDKWIKYDKEAEFHHTYPINNVRFQNWIRLDFNGDGKPDYQTPYELRAELATKQLDFSEEINRFKLGRALYHIAERRGFKSSKGETLSQHEEEEMAEGEAKPIELKESEQKLSQELDDYCKTQNYPTVGVALHKIHSEDHKRVRANYPVIRKQLKDEITYIFQFQNSLSCDSELYRRLLSEKKGEGTIFYYKGVSLSRKGQVGKCTLEPTKPRCSQSRPEFEEFRSWSLLNNIRYGEGCKQPLTQQEKEQLYHEAFLRATDFKFDKLRKWIEKKHQVKLVYTQEQASRTINYPDTTPILASVVSFRMRELLQLGEEWRTWSRSPENIQHTDSASRKNHKRHLNGMNSMTYHPVTYTWEDVWHVCFLADDEEPIRRFAEKSGLDEKGLLSLWNDMPIAYASLSLKAINNINRFLKKGLLYNEACLLAKLPDIFKEKWTQEVEDCLLLSLSNILKQNATERKLISAVNALIANYKALPCEERPGHKDMYYQLTASDRSDVERVVEDTFGTEILKQMDSIEKEAIMQKGVTLYQSFFADSTRNYLKVPRVDDAVKQFLLNHFDGLTEKSLAQLYHHSQIQYYKPAETQRVYVDEDNWVNVKQLGSPVLPALRNPMALRVMHTLRRKINYLLSSGIIDEDTRIVVEVARSLNDSNMRWAIEEYQNKKKDENDEIRKYLGELTGKDALQKGRMLVEQHDCNGQPKQEKKKQKEVFLFDKYMDKQKRQYKRWMEQGGFCIYTNTPITISKLINGTQFDIEHTIPRSLSFDDSMCNKTLCEAQFNRQVKKNSLPSQLPNYEQILQNIQPWMDRVELLRDRVNYWRHKSRKAQTKENKDKAIRQQHLWQMELDYWQKKVANFRAKEVTNGFRNNQLVDTSIIAKYSMHYLKSVFRRVEVQKGEVTATFRKIFGIQNVETAKVRDSHSHHAIDALVLTCIPSAATRDKLLRLHYEWLEAKEQCCDSDPIQQAIQQELRKLRLDTEELQDAIDKIKRTVLASFESKSQTLTPAKRRKRIDGKVVPVRDADGDILYERNEDGSFKKDPMGHRIPLAKQWMKGDCIRGSLHKDTYYGAIKPFNSDKVKYVVRRELRPKQRKIGFKDWDELQKVIVDKSLFDMIKKQIPEEGMTFKEAYEKYGFYMLDKKGNHINKIRHIRCYAKTKKPLEIRKQTNPSPFAYKNVYYAENDENVACALYEHESKRKFQCFMLYDVADNVRKEKTHNINELLPKSLPIEKGGKKKQIMEGKRLFVLTPGQMVILRGHEESVTALSPEEISKRYYRVCNIQKDRILLQHHLEARDDEALNKAYPNEKSGVNGFSKINLNDPYPRLLLSCQNHNFWIEGVDFQIVNGVVKGMK